MTATGSSKTGMTPIRVITKQGPSPVAARGTLSVVGIMHCVLQGSTAKYM